ncbi:vWA domain-containing protein [Paenibacillus sp. WLX2291]|uniref:vWA domain-containing protein n=1 Tax=Paenibacillus sp. WLX2291 TaxID=3296934 RepID=UPI0039842E86
MNKTQSVLNTDQYDRRRFDELLNVSEKLITVKEQGEKHIPLFSHLMGDMWAGLFKMQPRLLEEVPSDLSVNQQLMQHIMEDRDYTDLREFTRLDDFASALGTTKYSETTLRWITQQMDERQDVFDACDQYAQGLPDASQAVAKAISSALNDEGHALSNMLAKATEEAMTTKENVELLLGGLQAGNRAGELQRIPLQEKLILAEHLSHHPKMREIAKWAGRMKQIAYRKQRSTYTASMARSGVKQGQDISQLLPMELGYYASSITKMDFLRRYVEGQTLQYDTKGPESLAKGPIILCLDQSGSMSTLDAAAKGFTLALMSIARKQKRDFALIPFSDTAEQTFFYMRGNIKVEDMVRLATSFVGGGTKFKPPLLRAADVLNNHPFKQADIVFVTDGSSDDIDSTFMNDWNHLRQKKHVSVLSLLLGVESVSGVEAFSDRIVKASSFEDDAIHEVFTIGGKKNEAES